MHHSAYFELAEYVAASISIVSEPPRTEFTVPFIDGPDYIEFCTPEEYVV